MSRRGSRRVRRYFKHKSVVRNHRYLRRRLARSYNSRKRTGRYVRRLG